MATELNTGIFSYPARMPQEHPGYVPNIGPAEAAGSAQPLPGEGKILPLEAAKAARGERLDQAVTSLNEYVQAIRRELRFTIDEDTGRTIITVVDSETDEVIRQIPPEEVLMLAAHLGPGKGAVLRANT